MSNGDNETRLSLEQQVELLQRQLGEAQKLTALGELVGTTTHEFNNVLTTILNYARIGMRHKDEATRDKALEKISAAAQRAARITHAVLGMARNRNDQFEPTDLATVIDESLILLERELNKYRISLDKQFEDVPRALANGNQIQQILLNLLVNARQAMPQGGHLLLRLSYDAAQRMVVLTVRDTGKGIPQEQLHQIFDPFFSTKQGPDASGKGGTGLGLSCCRQIVEAHRGRIRVESTVGKGTAFTIMLPAAPTPTDRPAPASNSDQRNNPTTPGLPIDTPPLTEGPFAPPALG